MRKMASIRAIRDIKPIPNADKIQVAIIDGWEVIISKNDNLSIGDKVIYCEIDSLFPQEERFSFLEKNKYRIRTIKLRGQISQGLVLPISEYLPKRPSQYSIGEDVSEELGVTKYEVSEVEHYKKIPTQPLNFLMKYKLFRSIYLKVTKVNTDFPSFIAKTDEERIQNISEQYLNLSVRGTQFSTTEKIDGTSATFALKGSKFYVCSRNKNLPKQDDSVYWEIANTLQIKNTLKQMKKYFNASSVAVQGEIYGQTIQKNKYHINGIKFAAFNVVIDGKRLAPNDTETALKLFNLPSVPIINSKTTLTGLISEEVNLAKGKSTLYDTNREGLVYRSLDGEISFKVINPEFLIQHKE